MFSVIIPTCDRPKFLIKTIENVLRQNQQPSEIIIVNNGKKLFELPGKIRNRVKVYNIIPYAGVAQARNFGASLASSKYLAFLDDDDLWNPDYLANTAKAIAAGAICIVNRLHQLVDNEISLSKRTKANDLTINNILTFNPGITGTNVVISTKLFFDINGYDPKLPPSEDKSLILEVLKTGAEVKFLPENIAIIREHTGQRLSNSYLKMAEGIFQFTRKYKNLMTKRQYLTNQLKIFKYYYQSGRKIAGIQYIYAKILLSLINLCQSQKK